MKQVCKIVGVMMALALVSVMAHAERSQRMVTIAGEPFYVHTVAKGETFYSLGKTYDASEEEIKAVNPHLAEGLMPGQVVKIRAAKQEQPKMSQRQINKLFDTHTVNQGETAYSISKRYGVALATLMEDNPGFDPTHLAIGQQVKIRVESQGKTDAAQIDTEIQNYKETLNSVSSQFTHHVVAKGETLYSLGKMYQMPISQIEKYNAEVLKDGLKLGSILRIPIPAGQLREGTTSTSGAGNGGATQTATQTGSGAAPTGNTGAGAGTNAGVGAGSGSGFGTGIGAGIGIGTAAAAKIKEINPNAPLKVVMLLPLRTGTAANRNFLEFYQGALLAIEELKAMGVSTSVDTYNVGKSAAEAAALLNETPMQEADLIIGPVYEEGLPTIMEFASSRGIPVVSPLSSTDNPANELLFQVAPTASSKNDKLKEELSPDKNVIVISAASNDRDFQQEIEPLLPAAAHKLTYTKTIAPEIERLLSTEKPNVFVVLAASENTADEILARISSVQNNLVARTAKAPEITVIGSAQWARFQNVDKDLFFKLNLKYVTTYHADRGNMRVANFDRRYVGSFSSLPSPYAYRGYDVAKLFVGTMKLHGREFPIYLNDGELPLLQSPYNFTQQTNAGKYINKAWPKVCYRSDYTIEVK